MISGNFMTVAEVAEELQIDPSLVTRYCRQGRLQGERIGRTWFIRKGSLYAFARKPRSVGNPNFGRRRKRQRA